MKRLALRNRALPLYLSSCSASFTSISHHLVTGYEGFLHVLEACKTSPDMGTTTASHAAIIKNGYGNHASLISLLAYVYAASKCKDYAYKLLEEICYKNFEVVSANSMISDFMKIGEISLAKKMFHKVPSQDVVTWNSLIAGYVKNARFQDALAAFREMLKTDIQPDGYTFASAFASCARLGALGQAKWVHNTMIERSIELNFILASALIHMYAKCGKISIAREVFDAVERTNVSVWNAMINAYASHGLAFDAIGIFGMMKEENISPDAITFVGILIACSRCGLVEQARELFNMMSTDYFIGPELEHYGAMVDLLSRAGLVEEAYGVIKEMTVEPDIITWRTLLSACRTHKNFELAEVAISKIKHLSSGDFTLLSNMSCSDKNWDKSEVVRYMMKENKVRKSSGKSWLEINGEVHQFHAAGKSHREINQIYKVLEALTSRVKMEGFIADVDLVLMDVAEEEKEENLSYHSERLALAYGILKTSLGSEILITKNLRTCSDCHAWMKTISKLLNRVISVRDRVRFHRFEGGTCSCGDFW